MWSRLKNNLVLPLLALAIGLEQFWFGYDSFASGGPQSTWLPMMTYAVLFPLAYFVPAFWGRLGLGESSDREFDSADWATLAVFLAWVVVGVAFVSVGFTGLLVLGPTGVGLVGVVAMVVHWVKLR